MDVGLIIATATEMEALSEKFRGSFFSSNLNGFTVRNFRIGNHKIHAIESGAGEIKAAAATQALITGYRCTFIVNFGVCGALAPGLKTGEPVIVFSVVHYDRDVSAVDNCKPEHYDPFRDIEIPATASVFNAVAEKLPIFPVRCASGDKFIAGAEAKHALYLKYGTEICDMEAAGILLTAHRAGVPTLIVKAVSDDSDGGGDDYWATAERAAKNGVKVLTTVLEGGILE